MEKRKSIMKKSPALYVDIFILWTVLAVFLWWNFINVFIKEEYFLLDVETVSQLTKVLAKILLIFNAVFISYFWLNGLKDFIYVIWYYISKNRLMMRYEEILKVDTNNSNDRVIFVYCTCNDFDENSLLKSMKQDYKNFKTVILDDSNDDEYKKRVDEFSKKYNVEVVRRDNRIGFKAGNINNYLMREDVKNSYDYVVILDSDEILPTNYIKQALKYFYKYENIGIVQANHISTRNRNFFMRTFHIGVNSHWPTYQTMKHFYGFSTMLGHGAMIKRDCYLKAGGFPNLVAEDLCLSIEARDKDYFVAFAPNIICEEEYPIDYVAFKKRHSKWTQGNLEFIKKYTKKIVKSKMKWFEKWDIVLFTYNLPLTAIFAFFLLSNLIIAPLLKVNLGACYPLWMIIPTTIFFFSPMLNDIITYTFRLNIFKNLFYLINVIILYGSMLTTSLISAILGMFGKKAKFIVTPKTSKKIDLKFVLKFQCLELLLSTILLVISLYFKNTFSIILILFTGYFSVFLMFFSNIVYTSSQVEKIDKESKDITLKLNKLVNKNVSSSI